MGVVHESDPNEPTYDQSAERELDAIFEEISERIRRGDDVGVDTLIAQHPKYCERLRAALPGVRAMIELGHCGSSGTGKAGMKLPAPSAPDGGNSFQNGTLGDFRILRELGRGGMGVVYEAEQISLGRHVALKVLPFAAMLDDKQLNRFKNEARAAATLTHPNIVPVYSVGTDRGVHYYAMQMIAGQSLADVICELRQSGNRKDSPSADKRPGDIARSVGSGLVHAKNCQQATGAKSSPRSSADEGPSATVSSERECRTESSSTTATTILQAGISTDRVGRRSPFFHSVAKLGIQAAKALDHANENGVLHRDIKPANLLLDTTGQLYITDFGLARLEGDAGLTMTGDLIGTLRYMSPEQALANRVIVDHRSDIYSLGVTLYEFALLTPAFSATDRKELLHQIAFKEPTPPRKIDPSIPEDLETILLKSIEKDPHDRYATAGELAEDLRRFTEHEAIRAKPQGAARKLRKWVHRNAQVAAVFAIAVCAVAVIASVTGMVAMVAYRSERYQRGIAQKSEELAQRKGIAARQALRAERQARIEAEQNLYRAHIREASDAIRRGNMRRADTLLFQYFPHADETDFRNWEWYHLSERANGGSQSIDEHEGSPVFDVCFSPDGRQIASLSAEIVRLRSADSLHIIHELHIPHADMHAIAYSPDGRYLGAAARNGSLRIWTVADVTNTFVLIPQRAINGFPQGHPSFSPDGQRVALPLGTACTIWNIADKKVLNTIEPHDMGHAYEVAWSPNGNDLALAGGGELLVLDTVSGETRWRRHLHRHDLWGIDWSHDGSKIATGAYDAQAKIIDASTGEILLNLHHPAGVTEVRFSPDDRVVACSTSGHEVYLWESENGKLITSMAGHRSWVLGIDFHPDGCQLVTASADGTARLWRIDPRIAEIKEPTVGQDIGIDIDGRLVFRETSPGHFQVEDWPTRKVHLRQTGERVSWNQRRKLLAVQDGTTVTLIDWSTTRDVSTIRLDDGLVLNGGISNDGTLLLTTNADSTEIHIWHTESGERVNSIPCAPFVDTVWAPSGGLLAVTRNHALDIIDPTKSAPLAEIRAPGMRDDKRVVRWSPDGQRIATTGYSGIIQIWEARSGRQLHRLVGHHHDRFVAALDWSRDGRLLSSGGWDQDVMVWDTIEGRNVHLLEGHNSGIASIDFHPNGTRLATLAGGALKLWDVQNGEELLTIGESLTHPRSAIRWSPDGDTIWVYGYDGKSFTEPHAFTGFHEPTDERTNALRSTVGRHLFQKGVTLAHSNRIEDSDVHFAHGEALLGVQPSYRRRRAAAWIGLGLAPLAETDLQVAANDYRRPGAKNELAFLLANRYDDENRDPKQAELLATELVSEWPTIGQFWTTLGLSQYRLGKWQEAASSLQRAVDLIGSTAPLEHLLLAMAYVRLGELEKADKAFESQRWNPNHSWPRCVVNDADRQRLLEEYRTIRAAVDPP